MIVQNDPPVSLVNQRSWDTLNVKSRPRTPKLAQRGSARSRSWTNVIPHVHYGYVSVDHLIPYSVVVSFRLHSVTVNVQFSFAYIAFSVHVW